MEAQETKNLHALKVISKKLHEVSEVTGRLCQAVDIIAKNYAIDEERSRLLMDIENETTGE